MKERPILFTAESVRAILAGTKTQTRRVMKVQPVDKPELLDGKWHGLWQEENRGGKDQRYGVRCPHGVVGDRLWVKETWALTKDKPQWTAYRATSEFRSRAGKFEKFQVFDGPWNGPRFMPRVASRLTLEITGIRVERVQEITESDSLAEGVQQELVNPPDGYDPDNAHPPGAYGFVSWLRPFPQGKIHVFAREAYQEMWESINAKSGFGWDKNPWVWVIEFRRVP